ncbi:alcohol dehydrogenase GroES-like domain-containing protein [Colletotrichum truncatum]|uniref:Alcohol dehydrogenase GroES-like domain-containing protein n=1 Tax=Colletotrichum truncatum TaxID=5467 RepID=A0ACC3YFL2_COLTU|nr:alcohol dehydrogenase GroES-like domain-containing protein [Colletotrichum truncatum]KAF6788399.1 alcohol dehydrogenase GroES-like domain-containing protein [Colletotrichum truncatum]
MADLQTCLIQPHEGKGKPVVSQTQPVPKLKGAHDVLIRVSAVALNPTDYKIPEFHPTPGAILGCDFTGTVVEAGSEVHDIPPGTRLCGSVQGSNPACPETGAFAEYVVTDSRLLLKVPDSWSDLEAAALGAIGWATVALVVEDSLGLPGLPSKPAPLRADGTRTPVLVYGGATATGTMACQILSSAGYDPIVTASDASSALVKEFGAVTSVPYSSPTCGETIRKHTKGTLRHALDCITTPESLEACFTAISRTGGRYACLEYAPEEWRTRKAVKVDFPIAYVMSGQEVKLNGVFHRPADASKFDLAVRWRQEVQNLLDQKRLRCHPVREIPGKWDGIVKGLDMLKAGEVRGKKLVIRL